MKNEETIRSGKLSCVYDFHCIDARKRRVLVHALSSSYQAN